MTIFVTGVAGFIGFHVAKALITNGEQVVGLDNLNDYYEVSLKEARLSILNKSHEFSFYKGDISDPEAVQLILQDNRQINSIIHLAAQAGVRHSLGSPYIHEKSNIKGLLVVLEVARSLSNLRHFIFASSSSIYGGLTELPYRTTDATDKPISIYAATKKSGEAICHSYSHLYQIPITTLRFFTVYGPWGRPDMAAYIFTKNILRGQPIDVFNNGDMRRDFTYIDDIVSGVLGCIEKPPKSEKGNVPYDVYNLGNRRSEKLMDFIRVIEDELGQKAEIKFLPMQPGEVWETCADIDEATKIFGFEPKTDISEGLPLFIRWYREYYKI